MTESVTGETEQISEGEDNLWGKKVLRAAEVVRKILQWLLAVSIGYLILLKVGLLLFAPVENTATENPTPCDLRIQSGDLLATIFLTPCRWEIGGNDFERANILDIVGGVLAYAAAIELAYMLVTPGPDEAVQPLILGLASVVLSIASRAESLIASTNIGSNTGLLNASISIGFIVVAISILFYLRARFLRNPQSPINPPNSPASALNETIASEITVRLMSENNHHFKLPSLFRRNRRGS
jgi:hypothetical protein